MGALFLCTIVQFLFYDKARCHGATIYYRKTQACIVWELDAKVWPPESARVCQTTDRHVVSGIGNERSYE